MLENKFIKYSSYLISLFFLVYLIYLIVSSFFIVKNQFIDIGDTTYINQVREDDYTLKLANNLLQACKKDEICEVQKLLDFVSNIPYQINESVARSSKQVVKQNYGDCDDKSNLLISLLKVKNYKAYFVLVPKHIFVIVHLKQELKNKKALYINNKRFYILESTARNSRIAFPLRYEIEEIKAIIDPFKNKELKIKEIKYH